jgi:hypothetical protein
MLEPNLIMVMDVRNGRPFRTRERGEQMCIFHKYIRVEEVDDHSLCGNCFEQPKRWWPPERLVEYPKGYCPHSIKVCIKCGKVEGYGSHGRIREIPQSCLSQVIKMLDDFDVPWNR